MKSSLPVPASERSQANMSALPPVGPKGLCLEICVRGVVSHHPQGRESEVLARLKKRARLYYNLASIRRASM